jgi:hypothetical protein
MATNHVTTPLHGTATYPQEHVNQHLVAAGSAEPAHLIQPTAENDAARGATWALEDVECSYDLFDLQDSGLVAA